MTMNDISLRLVCRAIVTAWFVTVVAVSAEAGTYSDAVLADNPVAYYRLDEATGMTAANIGSGAGIDGTYTNIPGATVNNTSDYGDLGPRSPAFPGFESDNNSIFLDPEDGSGIRTIRFPASRWMSLMTLAPARSPLPVR